MEAAPKKLRIGDLLVQKGLLTDEQVGSALAEQKKTGRKLGQAVIDLGYVEEDTFLQLLSEQLRIPFVDLAHFKFDNALITQLPETHARRFRAVVLSEKPEGLMVGLADPMDILAIDELQRILRKPILPAVVRESEVLHALDTAYKKTEEIANLAEALEEDLREGDSDVAHLEVTEGASDAPVVKLLQTIFEEAVQVKASDVHLEPDEKVLRVRHRIDGVLHEQVVKEGRIASALVMRLKILSGLDISEKRLPQDGRFAIRIKNKNIDVRLSTMPIQHGESVVMRLLDQSAGVLNLDGLGMPAEIRERFRTLIRQPHGLILVTGPTGSGKTTTLYSALSELNKPENKIITAEDPVEYRLPRINQVQINSKIGLTFASVLRTALRQDPDIVLVGEMRDQETAEIGLRAAMTGHMVLSTLHTNDAVSSAMRLIDMGAESYLAAASLRAVLAQRLVRKVCDNCKKAHPLIGQELEWIRGAAPQFEVKNSFVKGDGCHHCSNTGYKGRIGIYELLEMTDDLLDALRRNNTSDFSKIAKNIPSFKTLTMMALDYAAAGVTTLEEVFRVTAAVDET